MEDTAAPYLSSLKLSWVIASRPTIHSARLFVTPRKETFPEHVETCYTKALGAVKFHVGARFFETPYITGTRVEEHRNQKEVDQASAYFLIIRRI